MKGDFILWMNFLSVIIYMKVNEKCFLLMLLSIFFFYVESFIDLLNLYYNSCRS